MNLENIMLSRRSQTQKTTYGIITFVWNDMLTTGKSILTESRLVVAQDSGDWKETDSEW